MNWITQLLTLLNSLLQFGTKLAPTDKQKEVTQEENKPKAQEQVKIEVQKLKGKELEDAIKLHRQHPQISANDFQKMLDGEKTVAEIQAKYQLY